MIVAGLAAVPLGAVVAVPAIRLSGVYLALATFGFVLLMERLAYRTGLLFGEANSRLAARPSIPGLSSTSDVAMYYIVVIVAVCAAVVVAAIGRSRLGRLLRALGDAPVGLATLGIDIVATRVLVFCISAGLAAVAGALLVATTGAMNGSGLGAFDSLTWLTVLTLAGRRVIPAGVVAAVALVVVPAYVSISSGLQSILFGATALAICCVRTAVGADGVTGWLMTHAPRTGSGPIAGRTADSWAPPFVGRVVARGAR